MGFLSKATAIYGYVKLMGVHWFLFRLKYEILKKINYFCRVNQKILIKTKDMDKKHLYYKRLGLLRSTFKGQQSFITKADYAMKGRIFSFSNDYLDYNENDTMNWHINPITKVKVDSTLPWNKLPDFGEYGDIKLIWEASRFSQVYYFIHAYEVSGDDLYAKACVSQITDWIENNPYPYGVHYKCGQEISFRLFSWIVAMEYFQAFISKEDEEKIVTNIYSSFLRVASNIDYAAKSVKNNHSISEAAGLLIIGLLFPQFPESTKMRDQGLKYLLKETSYQVYNDGSYIQHSFTYQRLVLDVLSFVSLVAQKTEFILPNELKKRQKKMAVFLHSFMQNNGYLPNYGSNDGANLFPLDTSDYRDFRSSLNFAFGESDFFSVLKDKDNNISKQIEFNDGGYYILKNKDIFSFIRCHSYKDRPASSDMFHFDIWYKGKNIFCDTGSYSYNTDTRFKNNFIGTIGHNTVMINDSNQMKRVLNFGYTNWTKTTCIVIGQEHFIGENYAYQKVFGVVQKREIILNNKKILISDNIINISETTNIKQIWNTPYKVEIIDQYSVKIAQCILSSNVPYKLEKSYISEYYNAYSIGTRIIFELDTDIECEIKTSMEFEA